MAQTVALEITREDGVKDLPASSARLYFARALMFERNGETAQAEEYLAKAIEAEAKFRAIPA